MRKIWLLLAAFATSSAMAEDRFDLECTARDVVVRYRIDLSAGQYCFGACRSVLEIHDTTANNIILYDEITDFPNGGEQFSKINRLTGEWHWYAYTARTMAKPQDIRGSCEAKPFTGVTPVQAKF